MKLNIVFYVILQFTLTFPECLVMYCLNNSSQQIASVVKRPSLLITQNGMPFVDSNKDHLHGNWFLFDFSEIRMLHYYRYLEVLLRRVSSGHIVFSPSHKAFVSLSSEGQLPFNAEEYADLMGKYDMNYMVKFLTLFLPF